MLKRLFYFASASLIAGSAIASPLSPQEALDRLSSRDIKSAGSKAMTAADLVYTETRDNHPMLYLFSKPGAGYLLVGADDVALPLLGYSDDVALLDTADIPENMCWWLSQYAEEIAAAKANADTKTFAMPKTDTSSEKGIVYPLLGYTMWNQDEPYNNMCPEVNGELCATGCVATAMAQLMRAHKWPEKGVGSVSYDWTNATLGTTTTLSADFSSMTFDWTNMLDTYKGSETDTQKNAVALLMKACGYSVDMSYDVASAGGSGAQSGYVAPALVNNFNYCYETAPLYRACYALSEWKDLIYNSLADGAPVYYSGANGSSGHAFVCDGYKDDYFHINWGWGGLSNGSFRLTALDPESQGIGGSTSGYNESQFAIINAKPMTDNSKPVYRMGCLDTFGASYDSSTSALTLSGNFVNMSSVTFKLLFGLKATDSEGNVTYLMSPYIYQLQSGYYFSSFDVYPSDLSAGDYTMEVVFAPYGNDSQSVSAKYSNEALQWQSIATAPDNPVSFSVTVDDDGNLTVADAADLDYLEASDVKFNTTMMRGKPFNFSANIYNGNAVETTANLYFCLFSYANNTLSLVNMTSPYVIDIEGGETQAIEVDSQFLYDTAAGSYYFSVAQETSSGSLMLISSLYPVTYEETAETTTLSCSSFVISDSSAVDSSEIHCTATLTCSEGYYAAPLYCFLRDSSGTYLYEYFITRNVYVSNGETKDVDFVCSFNGVEANKSYYIQLQAGSTSIALAKFTVLTTDVPQLLDSAEPGVVVAADGSWSVSAKTAIKSVALYGIDGALKPAEVDICGNSASVNADSLLPGVYLLMVTSKDGITVTKLKR